MVKEKEGGASKFIIVFVGVLLAVILLGVLTTTFVSPTTLGTATNESFLLNSTGLGCYAGNTVNTSNAKCNLTVANVPVDAGGTGLSSVVVTNKSGSALTVNTDYLVYAQIGVISMLNTTATNSTNLGNYALVSYQYAPQGYLQSDWARNLLGVTLGIIGLSILVYIIYFAVRKFEEED